MDPFASFRKKFVGGQFVRKGDGNEMRGLIVDARVLSGSKRFIEIICSDVRARTDNQEWFAADAVGVVVEDTFDIAGDVELALDAADLIPVRFLPPGHAECIDFTTFLKRVTVKEVPALVPFEEALIGNIFRDGRLHVLWLEPLPEANRIAIADVSPRDITCPIHINRVVLFGNEWSVYGTLVFGMSSFAIEGSGPTFWAAVADAIGLTHDWSNLRPRKPMCTLPH
ncbi:MAG: hypothetical protein NUV56_02205 [Candidatus Uhrbacteria bacterium]|nr:hypothetical protein [Candidatus Uhrbacteria bacterium]